MTVRSGAGEMNGIPGDHPTTSIRRHERLAGRCVMADPPTGREMESRMEIAFMCTMSPPEGEAGSGPGRDA
jgi:hypothetical protein